MGFQWLLFCFLCDWLFTHGDDRLNEINGTESLHPMIKINRVAEAFVKGIAVAAENNTNIMAVVTSARLQHAASSAATTQIEVIPLQTSMQQVVTSTARQQLKQERVGLQASNEFSDLSLPRQADTLARVDEFDKPENTHFLYYIIVFGAIIVCGYVASHNRKKIIGLLIEGHRPTNNTRRAALRYRLLSQYDDSGSVPTNVIY